jgi:hypothetical protein
MWEMSVGEQRYQAVLAVIGGGETVKDTAARFGVSRHRARLAREVLVAERGVALWQRLPLELGRGPVAGGDSG